MLGVVFLLCISSIKDDVNLVTGDTSALSMWTLYFPHRLNLDDITYVNLLYESTGDFVTDARNLGINVLGFGSNLTILNNVYIGPGYMNVQGPRFVTSDFLWLDNDGDLMSQTPPGIHIAKLTELTVRSIDERNTLCPCTEAKFECVTIGKTLPPICVYKNSTWALSNDSIAVNIIILLVLLGLVFAVIVRATYSSSINNGERR